MHVETLLEKKREGSALLLRDGASRRRMRPSWRGPVRECTEASASAGCPLLDAAWMEANGRGYPSEMFINRQRKLPVSGFYEAGWFSYASRQALDHGECP